MDEDDFDEDVQIIKEEKATKTRPLKSTWVASSFGDFGFSMTPNIKKSNTVQCTKATSNQSNGKNASTELSKSHSLFTSFSQADTSRKRPREPVHKLSQQIQSQPKPNLQAALHSDLWSDVHKPVSKSDLAVHKKKIEEISEWLFLNSGHIPKHAAPILLLTGPPGAGKTACIEVLCQERGIALQQWENEVSQNTEQWIPGEHRVSDRSKVDVYTSQSQSSQFQSFLLRANKYSPLDLCGSIAPSSKGRNAIILVEEMPNAFFRDTSQLHEILRKYHHNGHSPLIFIATESSSNSNGIQKLFPNYLQEELRIKQISVNPVAPTMLMKCLHYILRQEAKKGLHVPDQSVVETIAMASGGDIRAALNTLQFACRKDTLDLKSLSPSTLKAQLKRQGSLTQRKKSLTAKACGSNLSTANLSTAIGVKDASVFLFHGIGKILYFKRGNPVDFPDHPRVPKHLSDMERDPLLLDPEDVASKVHLSGDLFISYLHENYVEFLPSIEDLDRASNYFSDAEYLSAQWLGREQLENYAISIATRGFIYSNSNLIHYDSVRPNHGWRPIHKSQFFNTTKQMNNMHNRWTDLPFRLDNQHQGAFDSDGYHWEPEVLCTELLPYISLTNPTLHDASQISFVQGMTQFSKTFNVFRTKLERLDEKDVLEEEEDTMDERSNSGSTEMNVHKTARKAWDKDIDENPDDFDLEEDLDVDNEVPNSQQQVHGAVDQEDEIVIKEFED